MYISLSADIIDNYMLESILTNLRAYEIAFLVTSYSSVIFALIILARGKNSHFNILYGLTNVAIVIWALGRYKLLGADSLESARFWTHILYYGSILVHILFIHVIIVFLNKESKRKYILIFFYLNAIFLILLNTIDFIFDKHLFIKSIEPFMFFSWFERGSTLYNLHLLNELVIPSWALFEMLIAYNKVEPLKKSQLKLIIISSVFGFIGGNTIVLPIYGYNVVPIGVWFVPLNFLIMTYAIFRYGLISLRIIFTELFSFALIITFLVQTTFAETIEELAFRSLFLIITTIFVYLLIKSVYKEVEAREEIEHLAKDLANANERLKELDKLKSEFVSIASHQLRSPLTAIKGYASLIKDGSFGPVSAGVGEAIDKIFQSSQSLVLMVEDFLNISRIEQGRMKYEMSQMELSILVKEIIDELKPTVEKAGLSLTFSTDKQPPYFVKADKTKIRQVINNLIDNSVKYTPKGSISVTLSKKPAQGKILFAVSDTGIGIDAGTLPHLFSKFTRAKDANKVNVIGTGLGLYIVKEIIQGHGGRVWAESAGKDQGSTFYVELLEDSASIHATRVADFAKTM